MPEPSVPDAIAPARDLAPPPSILPDPDLRLIDLAAPAQPDRLDEDARAHLARAGQDALDDCLRRFAPEERAAFWRAICRCYNRPYNPVDAAPEEMGIAIAPVVAAQQESDPPLPDPHVIEAVRPGREGAAPDAALW
ncbi:hypothetical protein SAMN02799631_01427 [Methylobacterium sp. 174MFSha1.1]|uniref:hypothetical protein n=1 Tax=Methylobacterium sp. 174MFSha1.1 TaxID=1502749 RepID=UPI0008E9011C|nr:hypothetical protein [Methylobacterium sp. 174MFSha1.1]SFU60729.1 hypothetical protein SAMN02799631_01427 [Methylobacterium sp. 174MFSha1.1]